MALITNTEYKANAGITVSTYDTLITSLIAQAQAIAERLTGRNLESAERTERYDGPQDSNTIQLRSWPVTAVSAVKFYTGPTTYTTLGTDTYTYDGATGMLYLPGTGVPEVYASRDIEGYPIDPSIGTAPAFNVGTFAYAVTYTGGYATVPEDLKAAMYAMVDYLFAQRGTDPTLESESMMDYSYKRVTNTKTDPVSVARDLFWGFMGGGM